MGTCGHDVLREGVHAILAVGASLSAEAGSRQLASAAFKVFQPQMNADGHG